MEIFLAIIQILAIFGIPLLLLSFRNLKIVKWLGMIGTAYGLGILVSIFFFILKKCGVNASLNTDIGEIGSYLAIGIAIPLLLFSTNLKEIKKLSKTVLLSFLGLTISLLIVTTITFFAMNKKMENSDILGGMAIGLYTGGTPNLNAIGSILKLDNDTIALANLSDMMIGGIFYIFLLLLAKPMLKKVLSPSTNNHYLKEESDIKNYESLEKVPLKNVKKVSLCVILAIFMALTSALIGVVIWLLTGAKDGKMMDFVVPSLLIGVTVLGILTSFNKQIRETEGNNLVGQYLILVFSFSLSSCLDLTKLGSDFAKILLFYGCITIGTFLFHIFFAKIFKIDVDCTLVTLTAGLYGPAFIPAITNQIKNDELTAPGLIVGSLGYAIGTFLGLLMGLFFHLFI